MPLPIQIYQRIDREKLIKLREHKHLSQDELGSQLGVTGMTIRKFEMGQTSSPAIEFIMRYCEFFKIAFHDILIKTEREKMVRLMTGYFVQHDVIDHGSAQSIINFYSK